MFKSPALKLYDVLGDVIHNQRHYVLGRILTIIDASISDQEQRKGIKDLICEAYWSVGAYDRLKELLRQFFKKYANELTPKDKDDLAFWQDEGKEKAPSPNYFPED